MPAIECQDRPIHGGSVCKNDGIGPSLLAGFLHREDIVPKSSQAFDHGTVKVLVGVKMGHGVSRFAIQPNLLFDFLWMFLKISKRGLDVRR